MVKKKLSLLAIVPTILHVAALLPCANAASADFASEHAACLDCDRTIDLTREELICLQQRVVRYLRVKADPVLIPIVSCQGGNATQPADRTAGDPNLVIQGVAQGRNKLTSLRLSRPYLMCLVEHLPGLIEKPRKFDFTIDCGDPGSNHPVER